MNIVFFGASDFGLICLKTLIEKVENLKITGVVTSPKKFKISYGDCREVENVLHIDYKDICSKYKIPVYDLKENMKDNQLISVIKKWNPELIIVIGWYHLIPKKIREIPSKGVVGMHASLLPKYRGNAPLVWSIINGEKETGLSFFYIEEDVDTGDLISQKKVAIKFNDNIETVYKKIHLKGIEIIKEEIPKFINNNIIRKKQLGLDNKVWAPRSPEDGKIEWSMPSLDLYNFIRAQTKPYPGAFSYFRDTRIIIWEAKLFSIDLNKKYKEGQVIDVIENGHIKGILVATRDNDCPIIITKLRYRQKDFDGIEFGSLYKVKKGEIFKS